jgi:hypothetical protein
MRWPWEWWLPKPPPKIAITTARPVPPYRDGLCMEECRQSGTTNWDEHQRTGATYFPWWGARDEYCDALCRGLYRQHPVRPGEV